MCSRTTKNVEIQLGPMAHACNPSYSGGRDQEDHGSKAAQASSSQTLSHPVLKNPSQK
jgi:hypothetical protein